MCNGTPLGYVSHWVHKMLPSASIIIEDIHESVIYVFDIEQDQLRIDVTRANDLNATETVVAPFILYTTRSPFKCLHAKDPKPSLRAQNTSRNAVRAGRECEDDDGGAC